MCCLVYIRRNVNNEFLIRCTCERYDAPERVAYTLDPGWLVAGQSSANSLKSVGCEGSCTVWEPMHFG